MVAENEKRKLKGGRLRRCARSGRDKCTDCDEKDMNAENCDVIAQRERRKKRETPEDEEAR